MCRWANRVPARALRTRRQRREERTEEECWGHPKLLVEPADTSGGSSLSLSLFLSGLKHLVYTHPSLYYTHRLSVCVCAEIDVHTYTSIYKYMDTMQSLHSGQSTWCVSIELPNLSCWSPHSLYCRLDCVASTKCFAETVNTQFYIHKVSLWLFELYIPVQCIDGRWIRQS